MSEEEKENETPGWLLTYSDMVTLLVTFFVMLISLGTINVDKSKKILKEVSAGFSGDSLLEGGKEPFDKLFDEDFDILENTMPTGQLETDVITPEEDSYKYLSGIVREGDLNNFITIEEIKIGYKIKIPENFCFEEYEHILKWEAQAIFKKLESVLKMISGKIIIDTNDEVTDESELRSRSKTDLSLQRAINISEFLTASGEIRPQRIGISGYRTTGSENEDLIEITVLTKKL
ncbi:MAG: hypothetical protein MRJ65_11860 [Candidatus Brocadiaceae bacterium]|nr:hypothetical protein [Candidatus Brocadiaceae bacterium]